MSGKIELNVRKHPAKKRTLKYYPGWIWRVFQEKNSSFDENKFVELMPSWEDLEKALRQTIIHEKKVDIVTNRNPDTQRYQKFLKKMSVEFQQLQTTIPELSNIEPIYTECKK